MAIKAILDLRPLLGPARDQGPRPTCLAFAASDTHAGVRDGWIPLSPEYAFFSAQRREGRTPQQGATLTSMLDALREEGQPVEEDWPYQNVVPEPLIPPAAIGQLHRRGSVVPAVAMTTVRDWLDAGRPIILLTTLSRSFYRPGADGVVRAAPGESPDPAVRHAVVAVGHGLIDGHPAVLVRNSWGGGWGITGHAWLTEHYLKPRLFALAALLENPDVSSNSTPA